MPMSDSSAAIATPRTDALLDLTSPRVRRTCLHLILIAIALGAAGRIRQYSVRASYWNDEAAVVMNLMTRGWHQLTERLDYVQAAPPLFLWAERAVYRLLGPSEFALRALPLCFSLLALPLFARLAWRNLPPTAAVWAVAWFALFRFAIQGGCDVKQYSGDELISIVLLLLVFGGGGPDVRTRHVAMLSIAAAVLVWFSFPVVFLYGGIMAVLAPACLRNRSAAAAWIGGGVVFGISFLTLYHLVLAHTGNPALTDFWRQSFPDFSRGFHVVGWTLANLYGLFGYPFDGLGALVVILAIVGAATLINSGRRQLLLTLPAALLLAFVAAAMQRYPFPGRDRLGRYLIPLVLIVLGAGAEVQVAMPRARFAHLWWLVPLPLLGLQIGQFAKNMLHPEVYSTMRPVVDYVKAHRQVDEAIYLFGQDQKPAPTTGCNVEFLCYWPRPPGKVVTNYVEPSSIGERRFWVIYTLAKSERGDKHHAQTLLAQFGPGVSVVESVQPGRQSGAMLIERD